MLGHEFLSALRQDARFRHAIVFVLTTSNDDQDKQAAYHNGVAGYFLKSRVGAELAVVLSLLDTYSNTNVFPPN